MDSKEKSDALSTALQEARKQTSEYSAVLTIIEQIAGCTRKQDIIDKLKEIFEMLFGAQRVRYIDAIKEAEFLEKQYSAFIFNSEIQYLVSQEESEILLKISQNNEFFGILQAKYFLFPQYLNKYINFSISIAKVSALAFSNAKKFELLEESNSKLQETNRKLEIASAAKGQFLANMSHEIRTPMNGILGFLELLNYTNPSIEQKYFIDEAKSASDMLLHLINDILDFSKIEAGKVSMEKINFSIRNAIENSVSLFMPKATEKGIELLTVIKGCIPEAVIGDPSRIKQILNNLIGNAVKFTVNGAVSVTLDFVEEENEIAVLKFEVKDTGIGIRPEDTHTLFKSFSQVDASITRRYGGTGLGLAISKELIKMMGGTIDVKSVLGKGSSFTFDLRLKIAKRALEQKSSLEEKNPIVTKDTIKESLYEKKPTILLVEDNEINRMLLLNLLKSRGISCDVALEGREAYEAVVKKNYDIVFMDCQMPVMDGYESTAKIRQFEGDKKHTTIIAMTASAMEGDREKCIEAGMDEYISKPIDFDTLFRMIDAKVSSKK